MLVRLSIAAVLLLLQVQTPPCQRCEGRKVVTCGVCDGDWKNQKRESKCAGTNGCGGLGYRQCDGCRGKGTVKCDGCDGKGKVVTAVNLSPGGFGQGRGGSAKEMCRKCGGDGKTECGQCETMLYCPACKAVITDKPLPGERCPKCRPANDDQPRKLQPRKYWKVCGECGGTGSVTRSVTCAACERGMVKCQACQK